MLETVVIVLVASLVIGGFAVWREVKHLHVARLADKAEDAGEWRKLALAFADDQRDAANRLLIRHGIAPAPTIDPSRTPPSEIDHDKPEDQWAAEDERLEIEEKAKEALANPLQASLLEDAARYDPHWAAVLDRYNEMKRTN